MKSSQTSSRLFIDIETYSSVKLNDCGVYKYAESEDFELLLFAYSYNGEPVKVVDLAHHEQIPAQVLQDLRNPDVIKVAHNAAFERVCLSHYLSKERHIMSGFWDGPYKLSFLDPDQWECTMVRALSLGLPGSLDAVGKALNLTKQKMSEGKTLIRFFCNPNPKGKRRQPEDSPERWQTFVEYNRRDVETEIQIYEELSKYPVCEAEHAFYVMDQRINDRGILVDDVMIQNVLTFNEHYKKDLEQECIEICGIKPTMIAKLKEWIENREGVTLNGLAKADVKDLLSRDITPETRRVLKIRQEAGRSSVSKYQAFDRARCRDGRVHGAFQFYGAGRTGRWAGRLIQPQNFPRNEFDDLEPARSMVRDGQIKETGLLYPSVNGVLSTLVRTLVKAPQTFAIADYSAIEARVIAWIAQETWRQEAFRNGEDIYCASASKMFKVPVEKHGKNAHLRKKGKIAELALGYGGGVKALLAFDADKMGLSQPELEDIVSKWRKASPKITRLWYSIGNAAVEAVLTGQKQRCTRGIEFFLQGEILFMRIPSGRCLAYYKPLATEGEDGRYTLSYFGQTKNGAWGRVDTWGGKLVENLVQATARDCLANAMVRIMKKYPIVMHIHDEVVVEVPGPECLEEVEHLMANVPDQHLDWCPDLLLTADGFSSDYYRKE